MRRQDFSYELPEELIAQSPLAERSASRLLVLDGATGAVADRGMGDLPAYLNAGDLLVFNDTRVVAARIVGAKPSGGRVEIFLERVVERGGPESGGLGVQREQAIAGAQSGATAAQHGATGVQGGAAQAQSGARCRSESAFALRELGNRLERSEVAGEESDAAVTQSKIAAGGSGQALVQLRASKPIREGLEIATAGGTVRVIGREGDLWRVEVPGDALAFFEAWGEVPLPPYIHRAAGEIDRERYQSIFAREKGAVAAPTASLHFDSRLMARLDDMGVEKAFVTLHVGAGTFQPLRTDDLDAHQMHAERVSVSHGTWEAIQRTRARGGRVVAVGTTVVRALESAALAAPSQWPEFRAGALGEGEPAPGLRDRALPEGEPAPGLRDRTLREGESAPGLRDRALREGESVPGFRDRALRQGEPAARLRDRAPGKGEPLPMPRPSDGHSAPADEQARVEKQHSGAAAWSGETRLFIRPGFEFKVVDAMVTNFHLPESTLLMLVSAFAGREHVLAAYAHAVREKYRFFSYGDAMLVMPTQTALDGSTRQPTGKAAL